jgi:hypothetical protein
VSALPASNKPAPPSAQVEDTIWFRNVQRRVQIGTVKGKAQRLEAESDEHSMIELKVT